MVNGYKKTEIGAVPSEWDVLPFEEIFRTLSNNTLPRDQLNYDSGSIKDIHYGDILILFPEILDCSRDDIPYVNNDASISGKPLRDGDIIISDTAEDETVGKAVEVSNQANTNIVAGLHTIPCRVKYGKFASGWLGYFINSHYYHDQLIPYIHGTKVSSITRESLADTYIVVPPYEEQEKIVAALADISRLISESEKLIAKYQSIKQSCLQHMFPRKGQIEPDMRLPGFTGAWEQRKLGELGTLKNGMNFSKEAMGKGYPFVNLQNIFGNNVIDISKLGLAMASSTQLKEYSLQKGDVLFVRSSVKLEGVGEAALVSENLENTTYSGFIIRFHDQAGMDDNFKRFIFRTSSVRQQIMSQATDSANKNISQQVLSNIKIMIPEKAEQEIVGQYFSNLFTLITLHQRKCEKYKMIKQGMMEDLLTGKVRLK